MNERKARDKDGGRERERGRKGDRGRKKRSPIGEKVYPQKEMQNSLAWATCVMNSIDIIK